MKTLRIFLLFTLFSGFSLSAQNVSSLASNGVLEGVRWAATHPQQIKWFFTGMDHTWWYCRYRDGFTTWNDFRSYRDANNVWNYFALGRGDCDARYQDIYGQWRNICYETPFQAQQYVRQHGIIVDIGFQRSNGQNHSIVSY